MSQVKTQDAALIAFVFISLFLNFSGVSCLSVYLNESGAGSISTCSNGLRGGLDNYLFRGIVDGTGLSTLLSNLVDFQIKTTTASGFSLLCTVNLLNCTTPNIRPCYCEARTGNVFDIKANRTATASESDAEIRLQWANATGPNLVLSNILKITKVYDLNAVTSKLTIDGTVKTCPLNITYSSIIKFQCQNSPSPCRITISLDNTAVASGDHDDGIQYLVPRSVPSNVSHVLEFSYTVCGVPGTTIRCAINIATESNNTSTLSLTSSGQGALAGYCIGSVGTVGTGIAILYFILASKTTSFVFKLCVGILFLAEALCIAVIIVFALVKTTTNDPEPGSSTLAVWKILLIIYCVFNGVLLIAATVVAIIYFKKSKSDITVPSNGLRPSVDPDKSNAEFVTYGNAGKSAKQTSPNGSKAKSENNRTTERGNINQAFELNEETSNNDNVKTKEESVNSNDKSEVKKLKKKKSKQNSKSSKETKRSLPLPQINSTDKSPQLVIHPQAPVATRLRPTSIETTSNPYIK